MQTNIVNTRNYTKNGRREIFDVESGEMKLKIYIKSKLKIYDVVLAKEARLEREEFCASKFTFTVVKDSVVSFDQGDAVSVKYDNKGIFYGYVFSKKRDKEGLIEVVCYDQMRYLKNRRTYTRGKMRLDEIVNKMAKDYNLRLGKIERTNAVLSPVAADNVSLLDTLKKACKDTKKLSGERFIVYDDCGEMVLKNEKDLVVGVVVDASCAENFVYHDTIDNAVYNQVQLYSDTKRINLRTVTAVSDKETMDKWGTLILSKKATVPEEAYAEAKNLLEEYNRINRQIVIKRVSGNEEYVPGARVYVKMAMGELDIDRYVRIKKAVHVFGRNEYVADLYLDGSEVE